MHSARAAPADAHIAIAFSGGLDSTVLLDCAPCDARARRAVRLHVHHGFSPNADALARALRRRLRDSLGVRFAARRSTWRARAGGASKRRPAMRAIARWAQPVRRARRAAVADRASPGRPGRNRAAAIAARRRLWPACPAWRRNGSRPLLAVPLAWRAAAGLLRAAAGSTTRTQRELSHVDDESNTDPRYAATRCGTRCCRRWPCTFPASGSACAHGGACAVGAAAARRTGAQDLAMRACSDEHALRRDRTARARRAGPRLQPAAPLVAAARACACLDARG